MEAVTAKKVDNIWDGMPRASFDAVKAYLGEQLIDQLKLADWTIELARFAADSDCLASITVTYGRRWAVINLCTDFATQAPEIQRHTLIHELLHCHTDPIKANLENVITELYGKVSWNTLWGPLHRDVELLTDDLANAIATFFPLPEIPRGDE